MPDFLTSTSTAIQAYTVPNDWNPVDNFVEVVGPGGNGSARQSSTRAGTGGGGGSYARRNNVNLNAGDVIYYDLPAGGANRDAWFNDLNLCLRTDNGIGGTGWSNFNISATQSQTGPGSVGSVASLLTENTATAQHYSEQTGIPKPASTAIQITCTVYAKANGANRGVIIGIDSNAYTGGSNVWVDLGSGTILGSSGTYGSGWSSYSASISDAGSGWYRIVLRGTVNEANATFQTYVSTITDPGGGWTYTYTGNGSSGVYIYGINITYGAKDKGFTATTTTALYSARAKCGTNGTTSAAGVGQAGSVGDTTAQGGDGNRPAASVTTGGGGGGAAGPAGAGGTASTSTGGSANNGTTAGASAGNNGNSGTEWQASPARGCGSGAGGRAGGTGNGFTGGSYGGGGSGCGTAAAGTGGAGAQALIVLTPQNARRVAPTWSNAAVMRAASW